MLESVLSCSKFSNGAIRLTKNHVSGLWERCRANFCEPSEPLSVGQGLDTPTSRPNLSRSPAQAHAPFFVVSSRTITLALPAVCAARTVHSTFCPLSLGAWYDSLCGSLVLGTGKDVQHHRGRVVLLS